MEKIKKIFESGPSGRGGYIYKLQIKEGTTFKDFIKYVLNDIYEFGCIYVTIKDSSIENGEFAFESEKIRHIKITYKNKNVIENISDIYLYNENQDTEIDINKKSVLFSEFNIGDYEITLK